MSVKLHDEGRVELAPVMSNFDHEINQKVAEQLKVEHSYAQYAGWNFCGYVWWDGETYRCEVWHYREPVEEVSGTLEEIMEAVSDKWSHE